MEIEMVCYDCRVRKGKVHKASCPVVRKNKTACWVDKSTNKPVMGG